MSDAGLVRVKGNRDERICGHPNAATSKGFRKGVVERENGGLVAGQKGYIGLGAQEKKTRQLLRPPHGRGERG